jgi:hypothetical protein
MLITQQSQDIFGNYDWIGDGAIGDWSDGSKSIKIDADTTMHITDQYSTDWMTFSGAGGWISFGDTFGPFDFYFKGSGALITTSGEIQTSGGTGIDITYDDVSIGYDLSVIGDVNIDSRLTVGSTAGFVTGTVLAVAEAILSNVTVKAISNTVDWSSNINSTNAIIGNFSNMRINPSGARTGNLGSIMGYYGQINVKWTSAISIANASVFYSKFQADGDYTGVIAQACLFEGTTAWSTIGGSIENAYGLLLDDIVGGTELNYSIKTGLGNVYFGDTTWIDGDLHIIDGEIEVDGIITCVSVNSGITWDLGVVGDKIYSPASGIVVQEYLAACVIYTDSDDSDSSTTWAVNIFEGLIYPAVTEDNVLFRIRKDHIILFGGCEATPISKYASNITLTSLNSTALVDTTFGNVTVKLQNTDLVAGQKFNIKCTIANNICSIDGNGNTIDKQTTIELLLYDCVTVQWDGIEWWII